MYIKCLACEALSRMVYLSAARSPHTVDVELFRLGWHNDPDDLRERLQAAIDAAANDMERRYDAVVMAYGLCGRATAGLTARGVPLVLPRAHDCITIFLGGRARYGKEFSGNPGTYWYVRDYVERKTGDTALSLGAEGYETIEAQYDEYVTKYGKDNADYLMEVMGAWSQHYNRAAYIDMGLGDSSEVEAETQAEAARRGWTFEKLAGDMVLIRKLIDGEWDDDMLVVEPGEQIQMAYDEGVVKCGQVGEPEERQGRTEKKGALDQSLFHFTS